MREEAINCYVEGTNDGSFRKLTRAPQFSLLATVGSGPIRGFCQAASYLYIVSGNMLYKAQVSPVSGDMVYDDLGSIVGNSGPVQIQAIGGSSPQVLVVANNLGFLWDETSSTFSQVTDPNFTPGVSLVAYNERFWITRNGTDKFACSDVYPGGATWNALSFDSIDNTSDIATAIGNLNTEIYPFGRKHVEMYQDNGLSVGFPVTRVNGGTQQRGCVAPLTLHRVENSLVWLADDLTVRSISGGIMEKISDLALETEVKKYVNPQYAFATFVDYPFYKAYAITFPGNDVTWCYEIQKRTWHKRDSLGTDGWRIGASINYNQLTILGDRVNGNIYKMDNNSYSEDDIGNVIITFVTPPVYSDNAPLNISMVELICDVGVGERGSVDSLGILQNDPIDPKISLEISLDGGATYTQQPSRSLGRIGYYKTKVIWRPNIYVPRGQELVMKFRVYNAAEFSAYELWADVEAGIE
jgi:hypothetical protein